MPLETLIDRSEQHDRDARRLVLAPSVVAGVAGVVVASLAALLAGLGAWFLLVGLCGGVLVAFGAWRWILMCLARDPLAALPRRLASEDSDARLLNIVEGLSITAGIDQPVVWVVDDLNVNIASAEVDGVPHLVATSALAKTLDRLELEAVVAVMIGRIRAADSRLVSAGVNYVGWGEMGEPTGWRSVGASRRARRVVQLLAPQRDFLSDTTGVSLTRFPPSLASALAKIAAGGAVVSGAMPLMAPLFLVCPFDPSATGVVARILGDTFEQLDHREMYLLEW